MGKDLPKFAFFTGKGGVGKTSLACATALELAERGRKVLLVSTDPASNVGHVFESAIGNHITAIAQVAASMPSRSIPKRQPRNTATASSAPCADHVLETKGKDLDSHARALLEEDLRSPCTEEIAVFQAFSRVIRESSRHFVVMDTAPTGHTLLLLDATGSYHRDIVRHAVPGSHGKVVTPMMRLQDAEQTKILIVTLPETTPVLEAAHLQEDLRRAGIEPLRHSHIWCELLHGAG